MSSQVVVFWFMPLIQSRVSKCCTITDYYPAACTAPIIGIMFCDSFGQGDNIMEMESKGFTKERAKEMVNISCMLKGLIKNPKIAYKNHWMICIVLLIVLCVIFAVLLPLGLMWQEAFLLILAGVYLMMIIIYIIRLINMNKVYKMYLNMSTDRKTVFEEDGVILKVPGVSDTKFYWESFQLARVFDHNIFFVPKDISIQPLSMPVERLDQLKQYMSENNVSMEIYEPVEYGRG